MVNKLMGKAGRKGRKGRQHHLCGDSWPGSSAANVDGDWWGRYKGRQLANLANLCMLA
jgi:hypothetical protein